jgi:hypothetical protein
MSSVEVEPLNSSSSVPLAKSAAGSSPRGATDRAAEGADPAAAVPFAARL